MAEIFDKFTPEMQLALIHSNTFTDVFNEQVTAKMNQICAKFPDKSQLFQEMESKKTGFLKLLIKAEYQSEEKQQIKDMIQ